MILPECGQRLGGKILTRSPQRLLKFLEVEPPLDFAVGGWL